MRYIIPNNIVSVDMGDELLLSMDKEKVIQLKGTSRTIFETALVANCIDEIIEAIRMEYNVNIDDSELQNDIKECLDVLVKNGILLPEINY